MTRAVWNRITLTLQVGDQTAHLSDHRTRLLTALTEADATGRLVRYPVILRAAQVFRDAEAVRNTVKNLRRQIEAMGAAPCIETVAAQGLIWTGDVVRPLSPRPAPLAGVDGVALTYPEAQAALFNLGFDRRGNGRDVLTGRAVGLWLHHDGRFAILAELAGGGAMIAAQGPVWER